jgi:hypothetical protein
MEHLSRPNPVVWGQAQVLNYGGPVASTGQATQPSPRRSGGQGWWERLLSRLADPVGGSVAFAVRTGDSGAVLPCGNPACHVLPPTRRMHVPLLLLVGSLLPLPAPGQYSGSGEVANWPPTSGRSYVPGNPAPYGGDPGAGSGEPSFDYAMPPSEVWGAGSAQARPLVAYPGGSSAAPGRGAAAGYMAPLAPAVGLPDGGTRGPSTRFGTQGFRFRGDKVPPDGAWQDSVEAPGYQFRPLTPTELDRSSEIDGWRPMSGEKERPAPAREPGSTGQDAFGYRSDTWFRKYYGDRP